MGEEPRRIFPRSSAFEAQLAKVYLELWDIVDDDPARFVRRVNTFVSVFLPTMFQKHIKEDKRFSKLNEKLLEMLKRIDMLEKAKHDVDALTEDAINKGSIPAEEAEFAREVWHAAVDVLTEAGFNFPISAAKPRRRMRP